MAGRPKKEAEVVNPADAPMPENPMMGVFEEYPVNVNARFRVNDAGVQKLAGYTGTIGSNPIDGRTNIRCDRHYVENLNSRWFNRKTFFKEIGDTRTALAHDIKSGELYDSTEFDNKN